MYFDGGSRASVLCFERLLKILADRFRLSKHLKNTGNVFEVFCEGQKAISVLWVLLHHSDSDYNCMCRNMFKIAKMQELIMLCFMLTFKNSK